MKYCVRCKVSIMNPTENCPVCGKHLHGDLTESVTPYINFEVMEKNERLSITKLLLFIQVVFTILLVLINVLTFDGLWWSLIPVSAVWLLLSIIASPIVKKKITPSMVIGDTVIVSLFLIAIDALTTKTGWAVNYVIPFILFGVSLTVTVIVILKKMTRKKFYMFQMTIAFLCILPVLIRIFVDFLLWPSLVAAMYGMITIIGLLVFGDKTLKNETKKRLHF